MTAKTRTIPVRRTFELHSIEELDAFKRANGGGIERFSADEFHADLHSWILPGFQMDELRSTPYAGRWGRPEREPVDGLAISLTCMVSGEAVTYPTNGEAYYAPMGSVEIAGYDSSQKYEQLPGGDGLIQVRAVYLPVEHLRALGTVVAPDRMSLLPLSPLQSIVDTYFRTLPDLVGNTGGEALVNNFTELVSFMLRGIDTPGVEDSPGVLFSYYVRAVELMRQWYRDPDLNIGRVSVTLRISERRLYQAFEKQNRSFRQELSSIRMQQATARLATRLPGEKISTIAFDCGFDSLATFNRLFRSTFDCSPRDWAGFKKKP